MAIVLKNGKQLPLLGVGTSKVTEETVVHALEKGVRHIDAATGYANEEMVCRAIKKAGIGNHPLFLTVKHNRNDFEKGVRYSVEKSLRDLDRKIDLLLVHSPDEDLPMGKILDELVLLQGEGKIGGVGVSNFTQPQIKWCVERHFPILVNQVEFHPLFQQWELKRYCDEKGVALCAYRPLAKGKVCQDDRLKAIGEKYHKSAAQVAWRWALQLGMPVVSKVSGQHVDEYMSLFDFQLTEKEMEQIQLINQKEQGQTCTGPWSNSVKPGANWG